MSTTGVPGTCSRCPSVQQAAPKQLSFRHTAMPPVLRIRYRSLHRHANLEYGTFINFKDAFLQVL